jgi:hypothetical protein
MEDWKYGSEMGTLTEVQVVERHLNGDDSNQKK